VTEEALRPARRELREALLQIRRELEPEVRGRWSAAIAGVLMGHAWWQQARCVAGFVGVRGEPETELMLERAIGEGKRVLLPRVLPSEPGQLEWSEVDDLRTLTVGRFGLREPPTAGDAGVDIAAADLVLVPGLAFASDGSRIGFGEGYYDRALASVRDAERPRRVGLCFSAFFDDHTIPIAEHDVPMHAVVTEGGVVMCSPSARFQP
jgi:5-formyltetrahydrofolate cyclo-ligase